MWNELLLEIWLSFTFTYKWKLMLTWPFTFTFTYKWSTTQHDLEPNWTRGEMLIYSLSLSWQFFLFQCLSTFQLEYKYTNLSWMQLNEGAEYSERIVDEYTLHQVFKSDKPKLFLEALSIFSSSYILGSLVQFVSSSCLQTRWQPCLISTGRLSSQGKTRIRSIALQSNDDLFHFDLDLYCHLSGMIWLSSP